MRPINAGAVLTMALVVASGGAASAQDAPVPSGPVELADIGGEPEWGTTSDILDTYMAQDFQLILGSEATGSAGSRRCVTGNCVWFAALHLPTGAQIRSLQLSACDGSTTGEVGFQLVGSPIVPGPLTQLMPVAGTGITAAPGCNTFVHVLFTPLSVQNATNGYLLSVTAAPDASQMLWTQLRVRYRLQVSAAPATATFPNDVPTSHPFFRFVEAMAASGLTGGCGTGSFCPDAAVTRGQLAVFLASALGLHFPN